MNCLCCGKIIDENRPLLADLTNSWHYKCIKAFFGNKEMPRIDITNESLKRLVDKNINKGLSVTGVQKKLSLNLSKDGDRRLTIMGYPAGYILKPQTEEYEKLPEAEAMVMHMADATGIDTVKHAIIKLKDGEKAYITKRIDRDENGELYAMEDFCQLSRRLTADKYKSSYEQCGGIINKYSSRGGFDLSELFLRIVFSYAVGNSDMHLKNFSLIETAPGSRKFVLSKAYDLLPVNAILPADTEQMALTVNGKKRNIRKKDFLALAENIKLNKKIAENLILKVISKKEDYIRFVEESLMSEKLKEREIKIIEERMSMF